MRHNPCKGFLDAETPTTLKLPCSKNLIPASNCFDPLQNNHILCSSSHDAYDIDPFQSQPGMSHLETPGLSPVEFATKTISSSSNHSGLDERQWNALIGIVTAIVGNILISFALNLQRYAHIRINRERAAWELRSKSSRNLSDYGTQSKDPDERARMNLKTPAARGGLGVRGQYDETTPLSDGRRPSSSSVQPAQIEEEKERHKSYLRSPWWWAGIILMTIGEAGNFLA